MLETYISSSERKPRFYSMISYLRAQLCCAVFSHTVETNLQFFIPEFRSLLCALATIIIKINLVYLIKCLYTTVKQNLFNTSSSGSSFTSVNENASLEVL